MYYVGIYTVFQKKTPTNVFSYFAKSTSHTTEIFLAVEDLVADNM